MLCPGFVVILCPFPLFRPKLFPLYIGYIYVVHSRTLLNQTSSQTFLVGYLSTETFIIRHKRLTIYHLGDCFINECKIRLPMMNILKKGTTFINTVESFATSYMICHAECIWYIENRFKRITLTLKTRHNLSIGVIIWLQPGNSQVIATVRRFSIKRLFHIAKLLASFAYFTTFIFRPAFCFLLQGTEGRH